jgi:hypothetical protein
VNAGIPPPYANCHIAVRRRIAGQGNRKSTVQSNQTHSMDQVHNLPDHVYFNAQHIVAGMVRAINVAM